MERIRSEAEKAVREVGKLFLEHCAEKDIMEKQGTANFVTSVDLAVESFMIQALQGILPESNIITEESEDNLFKLDRPTWILDPVDGTTNIMYDYRHSAISLALLLEGRVVMGFIYNPYTDEMFIGEKGKGAVLNGGPIQVSKNKKLADGLIGFGTTPYDRSRAAVTFSITQKIFVNSRDVRRSGSAALDMAYVACGRLDGFYELTLQPWDYAAGIIVLEEAGGTSSNWANQPLRCIAPDSVVATNGYIHRELVELLI